MVTMGMELSQRAGGHPLDVVARTTEGGWPMIKEFIEREEALSAIKQAFEKGERPSLYIKCIPAADVAEVRHGKWLCVDTDTEQFFLCNRCKKKEYWESNYCPNCGAKMDVEEV